jgi:regulator of replication initiation timing
MVISGVALGYAILSYKQDTDNSASNDRWQTELLETLRQQVTAEEKARQDLAIENGQLRQRLDALEKATPKQQASQKRKERQAAKLLESSPAH